MPKRRRSNGRSFTRKLRKTGGTRFGRRRAPRTVVARRKTGRVRFAKTGVMSRRTKSRTRSGVLMGKKAIRTKHCEEPLMAKGESIKSVADLKKFLLRPMPNRKLKLQPYELPVISVRHYYHNDVHYAIVPTLGNEVQEVQQFSMTSTFTPEVSGGKQPTGRDHFATRYNHYIVTSVDWKLKFKNMYSDVDSETVDADETYAVLWWSSSTSSTIPVGIDTIEEIKETIALGGGHSELAFLSTRIKKLPMPKMMAIGNASGPNRDDEGSMQPGRASMSGTFKIANWSTTDLGDGLSTVNRLKNFTSAAGSGSSPAAIMHIAVGNRNNWHATNDNPIIVEAELIYHT